jgi:hypothetical protein
MDQQAYLEARLENQIDWYDAKSQWNQKWYKRLKVFEIAAAALIPLLTGFMHQQDSVWYIIVGVLGSLIAICSGIAAVYKFQELWLEYRNVAETLRQHKFLFLTKSNPYQTDTAFPNLVEAVEAIIAKENSKWSSVQKTAEKPQE